MIQKAADNASIVLVGSFNAGIFQPAWFEKNELLPVTETQNAQIEMISNEIAILTISWVRIEVTGQRFLARTTDESMFSPLRDLIVGTFSLLEHTPVRHVGINREIEYRMPNEESWHAIGHKLAPKEPWEPYIKNPGMKSLMMEGRRDDNHDGVINITVRPILKQPLPGKEWLVGVSINDHIDLGENKTALDACQVLNGIWDDSLARSANISLGLITENSKNEQFITS